MCCWLRMCCRRKRRLSRVPDPPSDSLSFQSAAACGFCASLRLQSVLLANLEKKYFHFIVHLKISTESLNSLKILSLMRVRARHFQCEKKRLPDVKEQREPKIEKRDNFRRGLNSFMVCLDRRLFDSGLDLLSQLEMPNQGLRRTLLAAVFIFNFVGFAVHIVLNIAPQRSYETSLRSCCCLLHWEMNQL